MRIETLCLRLRALGARPAHEQRVLRLWAQAQPQDSGRRKTQDFLPASLRAALPALEDELNALARLRSPHPAQDGSERLLVELADGQTVESVLLPRDGLCVSSQVGCAVGCVFCMTGREGLVRQLGSAEIVAQVALGRSRRTVKKVVFMGMGEPAHNLDNVMEAIELLGTVGNIGHKSLVFSTVGDLRVFERLPQGRVKPALALSLHTTRADLRAQLLPRAPRIDPADLVEAGERYARATGYPVQYQWTLLEGINDSTDEMDGIAIAPRQIRGHEHDPVQHRGRPAIPAPGVGARGGTRTFAAPARCFDQAASVGRPGCRRRLRATACAGRGTTRCHRHAAAAACGALSVSGSDVVLTRTMAGRIS